MAREPEFKIDEAGLEALVAAGLEQTQAEYNEFLRATIREVRDDMTGQPVDEVYQELVIRLTAGLPNFTPHEEELREYAQAISDGTLTDSGGDQD